MNEGFRYSPAPNPRGGFTTRAVLGTQITEAELEAAVAAETGQSPAVCAQVFTSYLRQMLAAGGESRWSPGLYDLIGLYPTAGGSAEAPAAFRTAADLKAGVRLAYIAEAIAAWQQGLHLSSQGFAGLVTPLLASVISGQTDGVNEYVPGSIITIRGQHLKLDPLDPEQGVFFMRPDGSELRASLYGGITRLRVLAVVPDTLSGPLQVRVASYIYGSVRSALYAVTLRQVADPLPAS